MEMTQKSIMWAVLATTGTCLGGVQPVHAQQDDLTVLQEAAVTETEDGSLQELEGFSIIGTVSELQSLDFYAPNSSAVISAGESSDKGARKLDQALQYQAGILSEPFGADNKVEWFKIRGFDASTSLDGTPTTPSGYFTWKPELFGVESVEVLKGPSSLLFGASATGGVVNLITKRPRREESLQLNLEAGNNSRRGLSADYNGIANQAGNVYYRIVTQVRGEDAMQKHTDMDSYYLAPSVTVDFNERTSLTLLSSIQHEDGRPTNGFLSGYGTIIGTPHGRISRHLNAGEPGFDHLKRTQLSAGWLLNHQLNDDWNFTQNYKFTRLNLDQQNVFAYGSDNLRELLRGYSFTDGHTKTHYIDNRLSATLRLGDDVELLPSAGIDYLKSDTSGRNNGFGTAPNLDMFAPVYGVPFTITASPYEVDLSQWGAYAALQLNLKEKWRLTTGLRHDKAKSDSQIGGVDSRYNVSHNSANAGIMYVSDYGIAPYVSYSESFKPEVGVDGYGRGYKPYEGKQKELGVKLEPAWLDGTLTLAYFDIKEKNGLISDASNIQIQAGERTNKGVELEADVNLSPDTKLKAAYTRNHSRQDVRQDQTVDTALIPKHQASLWVSHYLALPASQDLTLAAGVRYNGSTEDQRYFPGERIASFTLLDLMARYTFNPAWGLQLNVRNLTDKDYVSACDFYCYYGGERTVDLQVQYRWQ